MPSQQLIVLRARRLRRVLSSISWFALLAIVLVLGAVAVVFTGDQSVAVVLALAAVAVSILSLKEN